MCTDLDGVTWCCGGRPNNEVRVVVLQRKGTAAAIKEQFIDVAGFTWCCGGRRNVVLQTNGAAAAIK